MEEIRADNTAHAVRLAHLLPDLIAEFEAQWTPEEIRDCTDAVLAHYDEAQIRSHVLTLARRRTRECLRAPTYYELETASGTTTQAPVCRVPRQRLPSGHRRRVGHRRRPSLTE